MLSNSTACHREIIHERINAANFTVLFQETATATPTFSGSHPDQSAATTLEARSSTSSKTAARWRAQVTASNFSKIIKVFLKLWYVYSFLRHNYFTLNRLQYSINTNFSQHWKAKNFIWLDDSFGSEEAVKMRQERRKVCIFPLEYVHFSGI